MCAISGFQPGDLLVACFVVCALLGFFFLRILGVGILVMSVESYGFLEFNEMVYRAEVGYIAGSGALGRIRCKVSYDFEHSVYGSGTVQREQRMSGFSEHHPLRSRPESMRSRS